MCDELSELSWGVVSEDVDEVGGTAVTPPHNHKLISFRLFSYQNFSIISISCLPG